MKDDPNRDPDQGRYSRKFQADFDRAAESLRSLGGKLSWSTAPWEAFEWRKGQIRIVFYAHRTNQGHRHIRARDGGNAYAKGAAEILHYLIQEGFRVNKDFRYSMGEYHDA